MDANFMKPLRDRGVRITPQRTFIWRALAGSRDHFTAEGLWDLVKESLPGLELSTVYRSLEVLTEVGLVVESRLPEGPRVFEARSAPHPHLVCEDCGRISHLDHTAGERVFDALRTEIEGFRPRGMQILVTGICAACDAGRSQTPNPET